MVFILGSSVTLEQFDGAPQAAYSKDLVDTSTCSMSDAEAELHAIVTL